MREIIFSIRGNQKDPLGNPIPYKRTLGGRFRQDSVDYVAWKEYVRAEFSRTAHVRDLEGDNKRSPHPPEVFEKKGIYYPLIIAKGERVRCDIVIEWADLAHGDGDNVLKGILDALFPDDKMVWAGSYESGPGKRKKGHAEVTLYVEEDPFNKK